MYDTLVAQSKDQEVPPDPPPLTRQDPNGNRASFHGYPSSPADGLSRHQSLPGYRVSLQRPPELPRPSDVPRPPTTRQQQHRPLSASSLSSSSSSSSSSLPRSGMDVKKSYLASIESLDDELSEDEPVLIKCTNTIHQGAGQSNAGTDRATSGQSTGLSHIDRVLLEIVETERTYVSDLREIIQGYLFRIPVHGREAKVNQADLTELFGNIEDIFRFNSLFLSELEQCGLDPVAVARTFVQHSAGFAVYTHYCTNYPRTVAVLTEVMGNPKTAEVFKERQTALHHNLPLGSYLLKPVQRILKYHLLLQNIVKHSDKDKKGYADVKNALSVMTSIASHINDMKRKHEHAVRVQEIQSLLYGWQGKDLTTYGELVAEGTFRMFGAKALRHIFLFDQMLVIAKKKEEAILSYKTHIMCSNLMLIESIQGEPLCFHVIPFDYPRLQYTFQARNLEQKREWCLQLKRVILENYNAVIPSHARQLVMELGQNKPEDATSSDRGGSSRRLHSAPEYLEKRKQDRERRKSEISLNRAFRLRKSTKKLSTRRARSCGQEERTETIPSSYEESRRSSADTSISLETRPTSREENDECAIKPSLIEPSTTASQGNKINSSFRAWNSLPEETTDTEAEEIERIKVRRLLQYRPPAPRNTIRCSETEDEYVTLYFAQEYANCNSQNSDNKYCGQLNNNRESIAFADGDEDNDYVEALDLVAQTEVTNVPEETNILPPTGRSSRLKLAKNKSENYDNLADFWAQQGTVKLKETEDAEQLEIVGFPLPPIEPSRFDWRSNSAVRRVQSFTGLAKSKVASLQHSWSFRQNQGARRKSSIDETQLLPGNSAEGISPTAPAIWLKRQEPHLSDGFNKCGSLPRSFQLISDLKDSSISSSSASSSFLNEEMKFESCRPRMRSEGCIDRKPASQEQGRPKTIASDKPMRGDFVEDLDRYIGQSSNERFDYSPCRQGLTTDCTNSPTISLENVNHTIHPEHKIYHPSGSKYSAFKTALSNVGLKFAILKNSSLSNNSSDPALELNSIDGETIRSKNSLSDRSASHSSILSNHDVSPKALTNKLMSSISRAYTAMIKQRLRRENYRPKDATEGSYTPLAARRSFPLTKPSSSVIGARMARPLESEYCVPKQLLTLPSLNRKKEELRPDSVLSESSNTTTSSEGDKIGSRNSHRNPIDTSLIDPLFFLEGDDSPSETSDGSADSYYERTFEEIENSLVEEMFRDSAIYSDPDDDLNLAELTFVEPVSSKQNNPTIGKAEQTCCHMVDQMVNDDESSDLSRFITPICFEFEETGSKSNEIGMETKPNECEPSVDNSFNCNESPVSETVIEKMRILEESVKFQKGKEMNGRSTLEGIKSIRQRRLELERCLKEKENVGKDEADLTVGDKIVVDFDRIIDAEAVVPRMRGWVKHIVHKLQSENNS